MRKGLTLAGGGLLAVAAAWAVITVLGDGGTDAATPATTPVPATAPITRQDLVDTKSVDGVLTYSDERRLSTGASGTVTWVAEEGAVIRRGRPLLKADREPVVLMYGKLPLYRELRQGVSDGPDVEQLERNLKALGYGDDLTVDDHFSYATRLAVEEWQDDRGCRRPAGWTPPRWCSCPRRSASPTPRSRSATGSAPDGRPSRSAASAGWCTWISTPPTSPWPARAPR
nr:hypothetical protein GCM10020093_065410 [Planobispora longispora]